MSQSIAPQLTDFPSATMVAVNDISLEVFEAGKENYGNPIILCHGWPGHATSWQGLVAALVAQGYHVIVPNQRGYGRSSKPADVSQYSITHLTGDLVALLDHYGYAKAVFVGHDWGAMVVWGLAQLHPERIEKLINLALPYQVRGDTPWLTFMARFLGEDYYFVHFNHQPGVADAILEANTQQFLRNIYRKNQPPITNGMEMIVLAEAEQPQGEAILTDEQLAVLVAAFEQSGFTASINWYRNLDNNWHILGDVDPIISHPTLMIYAEHDVIPKLDNLTDYVPNATVVPLNCGHWVQQEAPAETTRAMLDWLATG